MVFDFLPNLPKADLDDRAVEDLIEECLLRIPRYCPEWTNYNPSDPGITLLELFAWLMDQMLSRFNQVPRRNYVLFLELLGIRLQPPRPAQTEVTFYLVSDLPDVYTIPTGIQVATTNSPDTTPIIFSTDKPLQIGKPRLRHGLTAAWAEDTPTGSVLRDAIANRWTQNPEVGWTGSELPLFNEQPQPGNCFYLVFEPGEPLDGNVIALNVKARAATPTGIDPNQPPLRWEAWTGHHWQSVLLSSQDDETQGFSFRDFASKGGNPVQGVDVLLHLPINFPIAQFGQYQGRWLRVQYTTPKLNQPGYSQSPQLVGLSARAVGGTVAATQCEVITEELLGASNGEPSQTFQLQRFPVLERSEDEYIIVTPPGEVPQTWIEVNDFADSGPHDHHYTLDSITGIVQFGPLVREPTQLKQKTEIRAIAQTAPQRSHVLPAPSLEQQYGAVIPKGATIKMSRYRTGGGQAGNVQGGTINQLKSAVPYVTRAINHIPARYGADAESLEQAAIRVPQMLRTRDRAVTAEDFEVLARIAGKGAVARSKCLPVNPQKPGTVELLIIPQVSLGNIEAGVGIAPEQLSLTEPLKQQIREYLDERRLLGVNIEYSEPRYVGAIVQTEIALEPQYSNPEAQEEIRHKLNVALYRFLNPIIGGHEGEGWPWGKPLYTSDIVALLQKFPEIRRLGAVQLFALHRSATTQAWIRSQPLNIIEPGFGGVICSWSAQNVGFGHSISIVL